MFHATTPLFVQEWTGMCKALKYKDDYDSSTIENLSQTLKRLVLAVKGQSSKKAPYHVDQHDKLKG